jgi:D-alanyl-D-alanine dipeptidase
VRDVLPSDYIRTIEIQENNDPLVEISNDTNLFFDEGVDRPTFLRREVYEKLKIANSYLPEGFYFKVHDAYRSLERQQNGWIKRLKETKEQNPDLDDEEVERITRLKIANPFANGVGGHQTGGAIDITLCDEHGFDLNLGTLIPEHNNKTKTNSEFLTDVEKRNRDCLVKAMKRAGFINYPVEWWHFSYGDKMWAAYSWKSKCFYGYITIPNL